MSRRTAAWGVGIALSVAIVVIAVRQATAPSILLIRPRAATAEEVAHALAELPAGFREVLGGPAPEAAERLGLVVRAFDFTGGPFGCWIDFEEVGQRTARSPYPRDPWTLLRCDAKEGTLLLWLQPRAAPTMPQPLKERFLRNDPQVPNLTVGLDTSGQKTLRMEQYDNPGEPVVPLWFGWAGAEASERAVTATLEPGAEAVVMEIEATEKGASPPRRVRVVLTVRK